MRPGTHRLNLLKPLPRAPDARLNLSRRDFFGRSVRAAAVSALSAAYYPLLAASDGRRFKIGACEWSIGKMGDPAVFDVAKQIGLDGVQVSLGTAANDMQLRKPAVQQQYRDAANKVRLQ